MIKDSKYIKKAFESGITHADIKASIAHIPQHIISHDNAVCMYDENARVKMIKEVLYNEKR